jgi:hypothetical protein
MKISQGRKGSWYVLMVMVTSRGEIVSEGGKVYGGLWWL